MLSETRKEILSFLKKSRDILSTLSKKCKVKKERKCSGSEQYKYNGLSYVLTIYFVEENYLTDKQEKYLLYAPFSGYNKMAGSEEAKEIKEFLPEKTYECNGNHVKFLFSWSAVLAKSKKIPDSFDEMFKNIELRFLIKQEIYVQSRWFLADNALDNAAYGYSDKFDGLQKILGLLEYDAAKLENMLSANMSTEEKNILQNIIQTSEVKELYSSAQHQISIQSRIKTAYEEKLKKRRLLLASLFMAIFTASSLYKSVNDILEGTAENPWLLISMLMIAIATVVVDYYYK